MRAPKIPENELERLKALRDLQLLDTEPEDRFDRITHLAQEHFNVPIVLVSLVDEARQWFKSKQGLDACETGRDISFCGHAILHPDLFMIDNALLDERFADNPLVTGEPHIRFYAGAPLKSPTGVSVGTLCLIDRIPRSLTKKQQQQLREFADIVESEAARGALLKAQEEMAAQEKSLSAFASRLEIATKAGRVGVWDYNVVTNELVWDDRMIELYGLNREDFMGAYEAWQIALHPEDKKRAEFELEDALAGNKPFDTEFRIRWPNGELRYIHANAEVTRNAKGEPESMIGTNLDITERIQMELAYKLHDAIIESADLAIYSVDIEGNYLSWNHGATKVFGFDRDQVLGTRGTNFVPRESIQEEQRVFQEILAGTAVTQLETKRYRLDGSMADISANISPLLDDQGKINGFSFIARDITEAKKLERLKNEFVSTVSHELRTPLTSIRGALGLIHGKWSQALPEKARNLLEVANRNSERLTLLINDILDLEKIESGRMEFKMESFDLMALIDQAYEDNQGYAAKHAIQLVKKIDPQELYVSGDYHRLLQVLANLISNAIKFSAPGNEVSLHLNNNEHHCRISVVDHGAGIPEEFRDKIFERFTQADGSDTRKIGGTGLGLAISKAIVERHFGRMGFDSEIGLGTTFYFDLPKILAPTVSPAKTIQKVLVFGDREEFSQTLSGLFETLNVEATVNQNLNARQIAEAGFELVVVDLSSQQDKGIALVKQLHEDHSTENIPVVVFSGDVDPENQLVTGGVQLVSDWLTKPFNAEQLGDVIRRRLVGMDRPKILHVEDDPDLLDVTQQLFYGTADYQMAVSLQEARDKLNSQTYDLVLLDLNLVDGCGAELIADINEACPVIVFSANQVSEEVQNQVEAALVKSKVDNQQLLTTVQMVLAGGQPHQPENRLR